MILTKKNIRTLHHHGVIRKNKDNNHTSPAIEKKKFRVEIM
jgi:predicted transcriptional regulator